MGNDVVKFPTEYTSSLSLLSGTKEDVVTAIASTSSQSLNLDLSVKKLENDIKRHQQNIDYYNNLTLKMMNDLQILQHQQTDAELGLEKCKSEIDKFLGIINFDQTNKKSENDYEDIPLLKEELKTLENELVENTTLISDKLIQLEENYNQFKNK